MRPNGHTCRPIGSEYLLFDVTLFPSNSHFNSVYNLKRRVASLPPVDPDIFRELALVTRPAANAARSNVPIQFSCTLCHKLYRNRNAYQNHIRNQEHASNFDKYKSSDSAGDVVSTEDTKLSLDGLDLSDPISSVKVDDLVPNTFGEPSPSRCLFCNFESTTVEFNTDHMCKTHGMFIPDQDYLYDLEIFIGYLSKVVSRFCTCLYCGKTKETVEGVQQHMKDKGHCKLNFDDLSEYEPFYDFPSDSEMGDLETSTVVKNEESKPLREHQNATGLLPNDSRSSDDLELFLPSGKRLGHRSQSYVYRQNLHKLSPSPETAKPQAITVGESDEKHNPSSNHGRQVATRANGGTGIIGVPEQQKRALMAVERKMLRQESRARNDYRWALEKRVNQKNYSAVSIPARYSDSC